MVEHSVLKWWESYSNIHFLNQRLIWFVRKKLGYYPPKIIIENSSSKIFACLKALGWFVRKRFGCYQNTLIENFSNWKVLDCLFGKCLVITSKKIIIQNCSYKGFANCKKGVFQETSCPKDRFDGSWTRCMFQMVRCEEIWQMVLFQLILPIHTQISPRKCCHTYENILERRRNYTKYLMENRCLAPDKHFPKKCFSLKNITIIFRPVLAALSVKGLKSYVMICHTILILAIIYFLYTTDLWQKETSGYLKYAIT